MYSPRPWVPTRLTVNGCGKEAHVTFSIEMYQGKVGVSAFDSPFTTEASFEPAQADSLVELINQATNEARRYTKDASS